MSLTSVSRWASNLSPGGVRCAPLYIRKGRNPCGFRPFFYRRPQFFQAAVFRGPRLPAGFRLPYSEPPHDPEDETPHALGECQPPVRPPFPAAGAGADDASRRQDDSRHHGDDILPETMLRRAVITVPGQGETECPRGGIPLCGVFRGCRRGRGIPCGWCAYGTVSFAADACFDPDDAVQDMVPFAAEQDDVARPQGARARSAAEPDGGCRRRVCAGRVPCRGCRRKIGSGGRCWHCRRRRRFRGRDPQVLRLPGQVPGHISQLGSVRRCPVRCAAAAAYCALSCGFGLRVLRRASLRPVRRKGGWSAASAEGVWGVVTEYRAAGETGCRGIGQAFEVVDGDLRHDLGYEAADGVFQPLVVCE